MKVAGYYQDSIDDIDSVIERIPRFCYRSGFQPLNQTKITSDKGWGCCFRSAQGILAQYVIRMKKDNESLFKSVFPDCEDPLELFYDDPNAIFGIHSLVSATEKAGIKVGKWAKPSSIAAGVKIIFDSLGLICYVSQDFIFNKDKLKSDYNYPCLVLVPGLFGLDKFDTKFIPFLQLCLCTSESLGFVSGKKNSAFYFFGTDASNYYYFDPHVTKKPVVNKESEKSFFDLPIKSISVSTINPSVLLGFMCRNRSELEDMLMILTSCLASPITVQDDDDLAEIENAVLDIDDLECE